MTDWETERKLILYKLEELGRCIERLSTKIDGIPERIETNKVKINVLWAFMLGAFTLGGLVIAAALNRV